MEPVGHRHTDGDADKNNRSFGKKREGHCGSADGLSRTDSRSKTGNRNFLYAYFRHGNGRRYKEYRGWDPEKRNLLDLLSGTDHDGFSSPSDGAKSIPALFAVVVTPTAKFSNVSRQTGYKSLDFTRPLVSPSKGVKS